MTTSCSAETATTRSCRGPETTGRTVVAAYQQLGQSYMESGEAEAARRWFVEGIAKARARGDAHAAAEMEGFLAQIG